MALADTPLTPEVIEAVRRHWRLQPSADAPRRLQGGEESAAYRLGDDVVRIGPAWRTDAELEWCHLVAAGAARVVSEAVCPRTVLDGSTVVRVAGHPVTVWPFIAGERGDDCDARQRRDAARLLARLHRALAGLRIGPRPGQSAPLAPADDLVDPGLDAWLADFDRRHPRRQPLHGDFYAGNILVQADQVVALLDWDDAFVGPAERELACAAWEWGDGLYTMELRAAMTFVEDYASSGGPTKGVSEEGLRQLVRQRVRWEVQYARAGRLRGLEPDADDPAHQARQLNAFHSLRP